MTLLHILDYTAWSNFQYSEIMYYVACVKLWHDGRYTAIVLKCWH